MFTPTYDRLFDRWFISFEDDKTMIVSPWISPMNQKDTWEAYKKIPYQLSSEFLQSLISDSFEKEQHKSATASQKSDNEIKDALKLVALGSDYWKNLLAGAMTKNMLNFKEISLIKVVIDAEKTGKLPSAAQTKLILQIQKKINDQGIF